ncbi:hypothetical protein [Flavobacterium gawalongense]|uniref:Uncharacterized protein n=1 Tax=Flavobacterium gawalongense TaxID=2594432 RepID=A0A553BK09_9FLAO|nr:hypothetical protein [Flavobacterium gawalongense]TRX08570.1 hypothetical protein FNW11_10975 [Flavobacterium gawalongense]TRX09553.1 hypothetical protein FNW10_10860 [Flavobacterium gawalongense]TRX25562.1 hypothetical protein FNW38_10835 [Flavobacterium gawalongense]
MKKLHFSLILIFCFQINYSQDTINNLKEVVVVRKESNRKEMIAILKKIKYNLRENYEQGNINYLTNHFALKDNKDTLVNRKMLNSLNIKVLSKDNIRWMLNDDPNNSFHIDISPYTRFEPQVNDDYHTFALLIYHDSMQVIDFDFFNINNNYNYEISKVDDITTVKFTAHKYYTGYFTFNNKSYNLIRIVFMNTKPYNYYRWSHIGNEQSPLEFNSKWTYNKVTIKLDFTQTDRGKLLLANLDAMQELINFEFTRYNESKRIIDKDINLKFYTTLQMKIIQ